MSKRMSLTSALFVVCLTSLPAYADVSDYLGDTAKSSKCPKMIVIRPELSEKNVFFPVNAEDYDIASNMIASAVANKYEGATIISAKQLNDLKICNIPVALPKLKSYTKEPAIFGQSEGKATVSVLHFHSTYADAPDKEISVTASGDRHWGDSIPFINAIQAVCDKIQRTSF
jgi:hypothetical protein